MGLHFIKNGTKHDVCVKRPSLFPASATTYDNSQSGLSATRVQGAIDEVGTLETGTITSTYLQKSSLQKKNGNVCLFFRTKNNISNGATIGTIADGYRPSAPLWIPCVGYDGSGVNVTSYGIAEIGTDGKILMKSSSATFNYMSCSANYYV